MISKKTVCIFGGTGFLGRNLTQVLARLGYRIKIATRVPQSAYFLKPYGDVGQIVPVQCGYDKESMEKVIEGCDAVINLVGILFEKKKNKFSRVHTDFPKMIAQICSEKKIKNFVHVSALGCDKSSSKYARSKLNGEKAVLENFPNAVILRPSIVFGADDEFFNMFAKLSTFLPFFPLIGGGNTKFQPVYVGDIAKAMSHVLEKNLPEGELAQGNIYELGGPDIESFKELYQRLFREIGRKRPLISLPFGLAKIQAFFMGLAPKPMLTMDQVESLKTDNVISTEALTLSDLNVSPTAMDIILPTYLVCYKRGGLIGNKKEA